MKHVEARVLDGCALLHGVEHELAGNVPLGLRERVEVLPRQSPSGACCSKKVGTEAGA